MEGAGEGMVAIVQALQDAGLSVTLTNPAVGHDHVRRSQAYSGMNDNVTQKPEREALSNRTSAYWSQRAMPSARSARAMDAFADSLRKYPSMSPESSTSADIIQRLINYTQSKNLTKKSYRSKSLRSLRNTNEPTNDSNISRNKSSKNIQTYTRRESRARETSPYSQELKLNDRKGLHSPRSDGVRCKDNAFSATYDYLKAISPCVSPPRTTEVRYLQDVSKYVRDTLRQICDEQTTTCSKIASRFNEHKRDCPKKTGPASSESVNREVQTSSMRSCEASTVIHCEDSNSKIRPKTCTSCRRQLPCYNKSASVRKIRFSATDPCPRCIAREVVLKRECPKTKPCPCPDPEVEFRNKLKQLVLEWLKEIPVNRRFCSFEKKDRTKIGMDLVDKLMALRGVVNCEDRMRKYILDCLENLPMWLPSGKRDQEVFKNELADDLINNRLLDLFNTSDTFDETIAEWVNGLNFDYEGEPVDKGKVVQNFVKKLKPLNQYRTYDNDLFRDDLKENILDMLEKLLLQIEGSNIQYYNEQADILADILADLPKIEIVQKDLYKKLVNDLLKNVDEAKGLKPSERKRLVEQLSGNVKDLITQDMNDDDRQEIIRKVVDDWIGSTHADPDDLITYLRKKILEWLHNKPEFSGDSLSIVQGNEKLSKDLAKKVNDLLPEFFKDDNVKNLLLEDINDQLRDTLEKRGNFLISSSDLKTTKKLAKDLLNYLVDTVKESKKGKLERDLIKIVQDGLKKTPHLYGDISISKRDNDNLSEDIVKQFLQVPSKNLDNEDAKDNLTENIKDQLNEALDKRGNRPAPKAMEKLADNLFDKLKNAIQKEKEGNLLENVMRKKILESLNEVPELAGISSATKRENDKISIDLAIKILEVAPEYIDNEDVKDNLLEDINDQLYEALEKRGQRKNQKETKELAEDMLDKFVDAIERAKRSRKDSSSPVSDPLEKKLRQKVLEYLNDVPDLSGYTPSNEIYNDKISKAIAKKTKDLLPKLLEDDDVKSQLLEDINDELRYTLEDRGVDKSPKIIKKRANDLLNHLVDTVNESQKDKLERDLIKIVEDELKKTPQLSGNTPTSKRDNDNLIKDIVKQFLQVPSNNLDNKDVKDNLTDDINDKLNEALDKRGKREAPRLIKKLADNLFDKSKNAIQKEKEGNLLENVLRKKILVSLNEVPELAGVSSATKRDNDKLSKYLATKILEVPPEYINNEDVINNLLEDINYQLNETLEKRGQRKDPEQTKELAEDMLNKLLDAIERAKRSRKDSSSLVSDPLETKLRQKVIQYLNDVPDLSGYTPSNKIYNEEISKAIAKKTKDLLPKLLEDDNVKSQLLEDINDQIKDTFEDRGVDKSPKIVNKIANDLLNHLVNQVKESQKDKLERDLIKIVEDELKKTPQLSGHTLYRKRDNDNLIKEIVKQFLQVPSKNLDNEDVKDNLTENIKDQLNEALDKRGNRPAPKAMEKLADNLFDKLKNAIQIEKEGNLLENVLRKKILESLNEVPELAGVSSATKRDNDKISIDLATKILEVSPEYIDNEDVKDNLLEDINDQLNEALEKRGQRKDQKETKELAEDMLDKFVDATERAKRSRKDSSSPVSDTLEKKLRQKVLEYLNDVPDLSGYTPSNEVYNNKISKAIAKKTKDLLPKLLENDDVKSQLLEDINDQLRDTLEDRGVDKSPKIVNKIANDLLNHLVNQVKESQKDKLERDLIKIVEDELKKTPQLSGHTLYRKRDNDNLIKEIVKQFLQVPSKNLDNEDVKDNLTENIKDQLNEALDKRGNRPAPKAMEKLADNLFDKLKNAIQKEKEGNLLENVLRKKILESLNEVPELAGVSSATKRNNDKISIDLATKILEVSPEYIDNEDVKDNLLEDINDQLNEALEKRGQRKDQKETKELAEDMLDKFVDATERAKRSRKDSSSPVSDTLEKKLRQKVLEYLNDVPDLSGYTPSNEVYNNKISKAIAKKTKDLLPKLLENDDVKRQLLEDINDQLRDTLEDRGVDKSPKIIKKMANYLLNHLVDTVNESQKDKLERDLIKIVEDELKKTPQLSGNTPTSKRDNDNLIRDIVKQFLQVPSNNLDNKDVKDNLTDDINDKLNEALDKRGKREAPRFVKKMADNLFDKLKNVIQKEKEGNLLENVLRKKIRESLNEVPELAGVSSATKRENDKISIDLATKILEVSPEYIDNEDVKDNLLEDINDQLNEALEKRGQRKNQKETKELAEDMLDKFVDAIERAKRSRNDSSSPVSDPLEKKLRQKVLEYLNDVPDLSGYTPSNEINNDKISKAIAKKTKALLPKLLEDDDVKSQLLEDINDQLKDTLEDRGVDKSSKIIKYMANDLLNHLVDLIKIVQDKLKKTPQLSGDTPICNRYNDNLSEDTAKKCIQVPSINLDNEDVKDNLTEDINNHLNDIFDKRGKRQAPKAMMKLADNYLFDELTNEIQNEDNVTDQLKDTLEDRGVKKNPNIIKKMSNDLLNTLKQSQQGNVSNLEKDLRKIVQDELENTPQLSGDTPFSKKDNDNLSKDFAKQFLQVPPENFDNDDVKYNLVKNMNDQLKEALGKRGQRKAPKAMKKLADTLFDQFKNTIHKEKQIDPLENVLRQKILENLKEVPELASDNFSTLRDSNFSRDLAKKMIEVPPEDIDNDDVKDNLLEYINDELNEALKKRRHHKDPEHTKQLAKDMQNKLVDEIKKGRENVNAEPTDLRNQIWSWYKDIPELLVTDIAENKKFVEKLADDLQIIRNEGGSDRQIEDEIEKWLDETSKKKCVKFSKKEKDKLKIKMLGFIKAKSESSYDEPDETKRIVWNWFSNIPEIAVGYPSANKELTDRLADRLVSLKDEGGDTNQKLQDAIDDWLRKTSNLKGGHFNDPQKAKMRRNLMDSLKFALKPSSSLGDDDETKRKVWNWFKDIPRLSEGDNDKNKKLVQGLAKKLKKIQGDGKDKKYSQKMKDATDEWLENAYNKKGLVLTKKQKEKLVNKLADVFKSIPLQKSQSISADDDEEPSSPLWDWFKDIPELSGDKFENKLNVDELDKKLKKLGVRYLDTDAAEEIEDTIDDWLEDMADIKNMKIYSKKRKQLRKKLMGSLYPNYSSRRKSYSDEDVTQKVWEWFTDIPEISGGDLMKNKKIVKKLDDQLIKIHNENLDAKVAKHKMQGTIDNWLQDVALINGEKSNTRIKENLRNKLMISLQTRLPNEGKRKKRPSSSHDFEEFHNGPQIRDWFNNIPKLSNGNQSDDKKHVDGLIKRVQKIENADGDKEQKKFKLIGSIDNWLRRMAKKNSARLEKKEIESNRNNLMNALKPKRTNIKIHSASNDEGQKTEKQKLQEWFENISNLCDGNGVENKKLIDAMAKTIEKIYEKNDDTGKIADEIEDEVDTWIKTVSKKKKVRLSREEVEALKKSLLDSITNKPSFSISDETSSDTLNKISNSESLESDKDTLESNSTSNEPKYKSTEKKMNKLKALKRYKDASADVDEDRRKISEWLRALPGIKFNDETKSILIDKFTNKLKKLKKEGKVNNKKETNEEVENWLDDIYKKKGSKLDNITKEHLIKKLIDSVKSKESKKKNGNLSSDQSVDDDAQKIKRRASRSPEKTNQITYDSYKGPEDENDLDSEILKKEISTKTPDGDNEITRPSLSNSKDSKRWNKEPDVRFRDQGNNDKSPTRSIESPLNKYNTDTIMSEDEDTASYKCRTLSLNTPELGSPSSASRVLQLDSKTSPTTPTPEKDLRQLIIGAGIEPKIMPESSYQSANKHIKQKPTIKERQKPKGSILSISPKRKSFILKDTRHSDTPLPISETSLRKNPRLRARSDVASRDLIEKTIITPKLKIGDKKSPSNSNRSNATGIYYNSVEKSDSNEQRLGRKSVATQQPIQKSSKKSGQGENSTKTLVKFDKLTKAKISDFLAKTIDTITSPNYADVEEDIMLILIKDVDLPVNEIRALARMFIKRTRRNNGIEDSNDDAEKDDITIYELDSDSDNEDDSTDKFPRMMTKARHLVRGVFDETYVFEEDPEMKIQLEDAIVDLIADQLGQGDIDDSTKYALLKLLHDANVPKSIADDVCYKILRRARERTMSFSEYRPPLPSRNRIKSALTPNQKLAFLENAQKEISDFYDELTNTVSARSREIINEAIKDTVAKLADILDDPELRGEQKEDMMKNEIIRFLRKLPTQSNVPEEDLANQLMDRLQKIKFSSSTPEHSEVEDFNPRRENLDSSLSTIFDENKLEANETSFKAKIVEVIQNWSGNIDAIKKNVGFKDTMANDLANDIIDRQKYLQVNPDAKSSSEEELEHSKYIVFKWLNRMINLKDLAESGTKIINLVNAFSSIAVPKMAEPLKNASLWVLSGTSQGDLNYEDPLEADVAGWLQSVPKNLHARDDPNIQEQQIKQFVDTMKRDKDKPNVEELSGEEINKWLPKMVKADQLVIETMGNKLKNILKKNGFVNPPQRPATSQNKNTTNPKQPVEPKVTLQQQLPAQSAIASHHPEKQSKQLSMGLQQHEKSPQQTEQSQRSSASRTPPLLIPPQDYQYIVGNQQNPQMVPPDYVTSMVNDWVSTLPFNANNPEEQQHFDKMKQNLISQIKQIRQQYPITSYEYETKLREPIRFFLQNIPSYPEENQNDRYLDDKTNELLLNLSLIPTDTDRASPKFKKPVDVLYHLVDKWCKDLPIYSENTNEDPEKTSALKQNISSKLIYKLGELNINTEILNDDFLYEDLLLDEVDRQLKDVPKNPELDKYLPALKMELAAKVKDARQKIRDELAGQAYKQQLRDMISTSICLPNNLSPDEQASFEILKDNLADAFINLHYVPDNPEDVKKFKIKINDEINRFCDEFLRRHPRLPVDRRKLTRALYDALLCVPVPRDESMIHEVEQSRIKDIIDDWIKELPLKDETLTEQLHRNKTASLLAKRLHELEKEDTSNPDLENEMFEEISKWLRKQHLRPGQEVYIPEFADRLKNKLKSTEHYRRFDLSASPLHQTQSKRGMVCMGRIPPCTLSSEDRSHLQRIRERHRSPCSRDDTVCPRLNSFSQTEVKPKCSYRGSWCRKELCPGRTQAPTQTPGSYCSMRKKRDASCMTPTQSPYEISPHVIVKEYHWDTTDGSKQRTSFQQTRPPLQQPQGSHTSEYQTPRQSDHAPPPDYQTPRQSFLQQAPQNYVPPGPNYTSPQPSTSSAYQQPSCECYQPTTGEIPNQPIPSQYNKRHRRCFRSPDASSGDENYPESTSRRSRVRVTKLGSLDDTSCQRNRRPEQKKSRSRFCDEDSEWSSVKFPEDGDFWDCPRNRFYGARGPFIQEKEKREEKFKCKCKERVLTNCRGRHGRFYREHETRHCDINCPHPSHMYFR